MPSHIFARLGLWQEDIQSNVASLAAARQPSAMHIGAENQVHAMEFLEYAYLQIGRNDKAQELIGELQNVRKEDLNPGLEGYLDWNRAQFPARYALETRNWKDAVALQVAPDSDPRASAVTYWARAIAAGHLHDPASARDAVAQYDAMAQAVRNGPRPARAKSMETNRDEARAWLAFAEGKNGEALNLIRPIADKQDALGKGEVELPAREMLADMLLGMGRAQEALAEYEKSAKTDPNRFNGLYGAGRAAEVTGHSEEATRYYTQLLKNCGETGHQQRPELVHARSFLSERALEFSVSLWLLYNSLGHQRPFVGLFCGWPRGCYVPRSSASSCVCVSSSSLILLDHRCRGGARGACGIQPGTEKLRSRP
jgi:tetratricopeptide (TPR) repeat protein